MSLPNTIEKLHELLLGLGDLRAEVITQEECDGVLFARMFVGRAMSDLETAEDFLKHVHHKRRQAGEARSVS